MTQNVRYLPESHHFQYVERMNFGFVALRFVVEEDIVPKTYLKATNPGLGGAL